MAWYRISAAELRGASRRLTRDRLSLAAASASLAVGVGLNLVVADVVGDALLGRLPYRDADRLVTFVVHEDDMRPVLTDSEVLAIRHAGGPVDEMATIERWPANRRGLMDVQDGRVTRRVSGALVTPNLFQLLGVTAARGRLFGLGDAGPARNVAVVSDSLWARLFDRRPESVGSTLTVNGLEYVVIGVLPPSFVPPIPDLQRRSDVDRTIELWILQDPEQIVGMEGHGLRYDVIARLSKGGTAALAASHLQGLAGRVGLRESRSEFGARSLRASMLAHVRGHYVLVAIVCTLVLVIALTSAATAITLRVVDQAPAFALRAALGGSPVQLLIVPFVESLAVACVGGAVASAAFWWSSGLLEGLVPLPPWIHARGEHGRYVWAAASALVVTAAAAGTAMAGSVAVRFDARRLLGDVRHRRVGFALPAGWREVLLAVQLAVLFAVAAPGLVLLRDVLGARDAASGLAKANVVAAEAWIVERRPFDEIVAFQDAIVQRLRELPGVTRVSLGSNPPMVGPTMRTYRLRLPDRNSASGDRWHSAFGEHIDEEQLAILGLRTIRGRSILSTDLGGSEPVAVISESLSRSLFGDRDALEQKVEWHGLRRIVGVVQDAPWDDAGLAADGRPTLFVPRRQDALRRFSLLVECTSPAEAQRIARLLPTIDPEQPFDRIMTLDRVAMLALQHETSVMQGLLLVGACGWVLTLAALYMNANHLVTSREPELAIRVALGGTRWQVLGVIIRAHAQIIVYGLLVGLPAAWWLTQRAAGVTLSPVEGAGTFAAAAVGVIVAACGMCAMAAWPLTSRTPVEQLRRVGSL